MTFKSSWLAALGFGFCLAKIVVPTEVSKFHTKLLVATYRLPFTAACHTHLIAKQEPDNGHTRSSGAIVPCGYRVTKHLRRRTSLTHSSKVPNVTPLLFRLTNQAKYRTRPGAAKRTFLTVCSVATLVDKRNWSEACE